MQKQNSNGIKKAICSKLVAHKSRLSQLWDSDDFDNEIFPSLVSQKKWKRRSKKTITTWCMNDEVSDNENIEEVRNFFNGNEFNFNMSEKPLSLDCIIRHYDNDHNGLDGFDVFVVTDPEDKDIILITINS